MSTKFVIKEGKNLTNDELVVINSWRKKEFNSKSVIKPEPGNDDWNKKYFILLNENDKIVAFARLHDVNLELKGKKYNILGLASLVSTERGRGYGKKLTLEMKKFIEGSGKNGIGFCNKKLTDFYRKCGFGIITDGTSRFIYKDDNGQLIKDPWGGGDVIYIRGKDDLTNRILSNSTENVISYRRYW